MTTSPFFIEISSPPTGSAVAQCPFCDIYLQAHSTDYDIVCALEGDDLDLRSELGRYFIYECKGWRRRATFTVFAKFCRVLDSGKCNFGILFSKEGISGIGGMTDAERERLKVFQERGMAIIVVAQTDLERLGSARIS